MAGFPKNAISCGFPPETFAENPQNRSISERIRMPEFTLTGLLFGLGHFFQLGNLSFDHQLQGQTRDTDSSFVD